MRVARFRGDALTLEIDHAFGRWGVLSTPIFWGIHCTVLSALCELTKISEALFGMLRRYYEIFNPTIREHPNYRNR